MLLLGHTGLTLAAAFSVDAIVTRIRGRSGSASTEPALVKSSRRRVFTWMAHEIDLRLLLVGSLLPDIIDKPLGIYILRGSYGSGRIFAHTVLFLLLTTAVALAVYFRWRRTGMLAIAFGCLTHLVFDQMWRTPQTLFWPLLGASFSHHVSGDDWVLQIARAVATRPDTYIPEIIGGTVLGGVLVWLLIHRRLSAFLRTGRLVGR